MTEAQAREAEAIMREQQAEIESLTRKLQDSPRGQSDGGVNDNRLCIGCLRWRCIFALLVGASLGLLAWTHSEAYEYLNSYFGDAEAATFALTAIVSLLPVAGVAVGWKIRLYKAGHPGVLRACVNMLAEFKRGLRG